MKKKKKGKDKGKLEGGKKKEKEEEEKSSRKGGQTRNNTKTDGDLQITKVSRGASRSSEAVCQQAPLHCFFFFNFFNEPTEE